MLLNLFFLDILILSLHLRDGVLYRQRTVDGNPHFQLIIPFGLRQTVLTGIHDELGHPGDAENIP